MKISTKGRYGLRALTDLAASGEGLKVSLPETAHRQNISLNYLEQVFSSLRKAGIVSSVKGAGGGYRLTRNMDEITVKEVLEALEGKFSIAERSLREHSDPVQLAIRSLVWDEIDRKTEEFLEGTTLGSLVRKYRIAVQEAENDGKEGQHDEKRLEI